MIASRPMCVCVSAAGNCMPPQITYNRKQLSPALAANGPPGAVCSTSSSGSMDSDLFQDWFTKVFLANTSRDTPQLLIMDSHASHLKVATLDMARSSNVIFLALPSKTTHVLQPLDKAVSSSLGQHYQSVSAAARLVKPDHKLTIGHFPKIFTEACVKAVTSANILASFKQTGISPLDRLTVPPAALLPSTVHVATAQPEANVTTPVDSDDDLVAQEPDIAGA
eukprot:scpid84590/ scgid10797/ 